MSAARAEKILYTLWLLSNKDYTKKELANELKKANMGQVSPYCLASYINTLNKKGFLIDIKKEGKNNRYHLSQKPFRLTFDDKEIEIFENIKKTVTSKKDISLIRKTMKLYYKIVLALDNEEQKNILADFGYYSKINWYLVWQLEKHCASKDVVLIDYAHPVKTSIKIQIHADSISIGEWSDKIYLWGELFNNGELSFLPVDRIFMIEKVIEKNVPFKIPINEFEYKISRRLFDEIELDKDESVVEKTKDFAIIKRNKNNKFYIAQRLMSFCPELYYISDDVIKEEVENRLKQLRKIYE